MLLFGKQKAKNLVRTRKAFKDFFPFAMLQSQLITTIFTIVRLIYFYLDLHRHHFIIYHPFIHNLTFSVVTK